uniref:Uncharacterized protein n=1 Tax=Arundo donax TaxID=35708 RepID=A0A0A9H8Z9_ARUDO
MLSVLRFFLSRNMIVVGREWLNKSVYGARFFFTHVRKCSLKLPLFLFVTWSGCLIEFLDSSQTTKNNV